MKSKKILPILLLVSAAGAWAEPAEKVLWPSAGAELKPQRDSTVSVLADGARGVVTGTAAEWPAKCTFVGKRVRSSGNLTNRSR